MKRVDGLGVELLGDVVSVWKHCCVTRFGGGSTGSVFGNPFGVSCLPSRAYSASVNKVTMKLN